MAKRKATRTGRARLPAHTAGEAKGKPDSRYIESSALVAAVLEGDAAARASIRAEGRRITSALTITEFSRAVLRARFAGRIDAQQHRAVLRTLQGFVRRCHIVSVTEAILANAARRFPAEPICTLDAIHLATVRELGEPPEFVTIVTRDARVRDNATALGHPVE